MTASWQQDSFVDRRQFGRRQTAWHAWVKMPGRTRIACLVRDMSRDGARIELPSTEWLPYNLSLVIEAIGAEYRCEVKYRRSDYLGVRFLEPAEAGVTPLSSMEELREWTPSRKSGRAAVRR